MCAPRMRTELIFPETDRCGGLLKSTVPKHHDKRGVWDRVELPHPWWPVMHLNKRDAGRWGPISYEKNPPPFHDLPVMPSSYEATKEATDLKIQSPPQSPEGWHLSLRDVSVPNHTQSLRSQHTNSPSVSSSVLEMKNKQTKTVFLSVSMNGFCRQQLTHRSITR